MRCFQLNVVVSIRHVEVAAYWIRLSSVILRAVPRIFSYIRR